MSQKIRLLFILIILIPVLTFAESFKENVDYKVLNFPQGELSQHCSKVSVVEFFSPACPWCFKLETSLETWLAKEPKNVVFSRIPLAFESGWDLYQRAYFIAEALHKEQIILPALFKAIHIEHQDLSSEKKLAEFFAKYGINPDNFDNFYHSPSVDLKVYRATQLMNQYKVYEIPTLIVNGKYLTSASLARGNDNRLIAILNELIKKAS